MSNDFQLAHHPDADELSAFAEGALPAHEREQTLAHLAQCARCREVVALALPPEVLEVSPAGGEERGVAGWFRGWRLAFPAAAALAAAAVIAVHVHRPKIVAPPVQVAEQRPLPPTLEDAVKADDQPMPAEVRQPRVRASAKPSGGSNVATAPQMSASPLATAQAQSLSDLPVQNRNAQNLAASRSVGGPRMQQNFTMNQLAQAAPAPSPAASPQVGMESLNGSVAMGAAGGAARPTVESDVASSDMTADKASVTTLATGTPVAVPSSLAVTSMVTRGARTLALDAHGELYVSDDGGRAWRAVSTPWSGRALRLEAASFAPGGGVEGNAAGSRSAPARLGAEVTGTVRDQSGAAIPGATLALTLPDASRVTAKTDGEGRYTLRAAAGMTGGLEVSAPGFTPQSIPVAMGDAKSRVQDVTLAVGQASEAVTVTASPGLMPTLRAGRKAVPPLNFNVVTDRGEHWSSTDGLSWQRVQ